MVLFSTQHPDVLFGKVEVAERLGVRGEDSLAPFVFKHAKRRGPFKNTNLNLKQREEQKHHSR